jgi:hypothetical protein
MCTSRYNHWLDLKDTIYFTEHRKLAETIANSGAKLPLPQSLIDSYKNNVTMFPDNGDARCRCSACRLHICFSCFSFTLAFCCYWTVIGLLLDCYWTVIGLLLDCYWTVIGLLLVCLGL